MTPKYFNACSTKQRNPPSPQKSKKNTLGLNRAILALLESEKKYIANLRTIQEKVGCELSKREEDLIFRNIRNIELVSQKIVNAVGKKLIAGFGENTPSDVDVWGQMGEVKKLDIGTMLNSMLFDNVKYTTNIVQYAASNTFRKSLLKERQETVCMEAPFERLCQYPVLLKDIIDNSDALSQIQCHCLSISLMKLNLLIYQCRDPKSTVTTWHEYETLVGFKFSTKEEDAELLLELETRFLQVSKMLDNFSFAANNFYASILAYTEQYCQFAELWYELLDGSPWNSIYTSPYESYMKFTSMQRQKFKYVKNDFEEYILPVLDDCFDCCKQAKIKLKLRQKWNNKPADTILLESQLREELPKLIRYIEEICLNLTLKIIRTSLQWWRGQK